MNMGEHTVSCLCTVPLESQMARTSRTPNKRELEARGRDGGRTGKLLKGAGSPVLRTAASSAWPVEIGNESVRPVEVGGPS